MEHAIDYVDDIVQYTCVFVFVHAHSILNCFRREFTL